MIPHRAKYILSAIEAYFYDSSVEALPDIVEPNDMQRLNHILNTSGIFLGELAREGLLINAKNNEPLDEHNIGISEMAIRIDVKGLRKLSATAHDEPNEGMGIE